MLMKKIQVLSLFIFFLLRGFAFQTYSQEVKWVEVEGMVPMENISKDEARRMAVEEALRKAVQEAVEVDALSEALVINFKVGAEINKPLPYGKVVEKEILGEGIKEIRKAEGAVPVLLYGVRMKSKVVVELGKVDPSFQLTVSLNRGSFKAGEEMEIRASATRDCHLNIFNVLEDERVLILVPNRYRQENFVKANEVFRFPDGGDQKKGVRLKMHGLEGRKSIRETIYILAVQQPLKIKAGKYREGIANYSGETAFIRDLVNEIVEIPLSERAEKFIQYQVLN